MGSGEYACDKKNEEEGGKGKGGTIRGQLALTTMLEDPEEPSDASSKLGLFYGPRHLWQRAEFWGRGRASGQKHQATWVQAQGGRILG